MYRTGVQVRGKRRMDRTGSGQRERRMYNSLRLDRRERCIGQVQLKEKRRMYRTGVQVRGKRRMDRTGSV